MAASALRQHRHPNPRLPVLMSTFGVLGPHFPQPSLLKNCLSLHLCHLGGKKATKIAHSREHCQSAELRKREERNVKHVSTAFVVAFETHFEFFAPSRAFDPNNLSEGRKGAHGRVWQVE